MIWSRAIKYHPFSMRVLIYPCYRIHVLSILCFQDFNYAEKLLLPPQSNIDFFFRELYSEKFCNVSFFINSKKKGKLIGTTIIPRYFLYGNKARKKKHIFLFNFDFVPQAGY